MTDNLKNKLNNFFEKYKDFYDERMIRYTYDHIEDYLNGGDAVDLLAQVSYAIDETPVSGKLIYDSFFEFLKEYNGIDKDILEVSCGMYPILADKIDKYQQKNKKGTIGAYDPLLITTKLGKIKLYKENFNEKTNIDKYSLLIGFYPCEATTKIIKRANEEDKDFTVALCGCTHFDDYYYFMTPTFNMWLNYVYGIAKDTLKGNREIEINNIEDLEYPIISSKRKILK